MGQRRRTGLLAIAAVLALALPATASAAWTHKGHGELKENASITLSGELSVSTEVGKVTCSTSIGATLTGESSTGTVNSYTVSEPSKCDLTESLGAVCGTHGATKVEKTGAWELTAEESQIKLSSIDLQFQFGKCLIPSLRIKGAATATPDNASAMSTLTLSGSQTLYNSQEEEAGSASLEGAPSVSPAATYGIKPTFEQTVWTMEDEYLGEDGEMGLEGKFSFSYSGGSVSCSASAVLSLTSGEVEEGAAEGEVESFTVSSPSGCVVGGGLKETCSGENPVKSVEKTGTWTLSASEEDISVSGLALDYEFKECSTTSLRVEGEATLAVEQPSAITATAFSGEPSIYNAAEERLGTAELGGIQAASPPGTFQLVETPKPPPKETDPKVDYTGYGHFEAHGGEGALVSESGLAISCSSITGEGEFEGPERGTVQLVYHGCHETTFGTHCESAGQPNGTIETEVLWFYSVTLTPGTHTAGVLIEPNVASGKFATFSCPVVGVHITVEGNGILGHISSSDGNPLYNEPHEELTVEFGVSEKGVSQAFTEICEDEETYGLESNAGGGLETATEEAHGYLTFDNPVELTTEE